MSSHPLPPATAERILAWFLRGNPAGRCVLGDLRQEFVALSGARTPARARRWYWSQVFGIGLRYMGLPIVIRPYVTAHRRPGIAYGAAENVRLAVRTLRCRPVFTAAAVLTLALGIGANAAMFSVVKEVILSPLPFAAADRVVQVWDRAPDASPASARPMSYMNFADYRSGNEVFSRMVAFTGAAVYRVEGEVLESVRSRYISAEFFEMMGVRPFAGRLFRPDEDLQGVVNVIVVTYEYWQRELGGEDVVGQVLPLQRFVAVRGAPWVQSGYEIIGILPPGVDLPPGLSSTGYGSLAGTDIFLPFGLSFGGPPIRGIYRLRVLAELKDGVTPEQARANLQGIAAGIAEEDPESQAGLTVEVAPVVEQPRRAYGAALGFLWAATALVLFVACASVSSLLLGWGVVREHELAVRGALGAGTRRIFGQLATEALVLAGFAGVLSLGLAYWGTGLIKALAPPGMHRLDEIGVDAGVLGFTLIVSLVTVLLVGLWPALRGARRRSSEALKEAGARGGTMARTRSLRVLISAEVALSLVLLTGAGLMLQTFWNLTGVETGVARDALLRVDIRRLQPDLSKHRGDEALIALFQLLRDRVEAVPGVTSFAMADIGPLTGRETTGGDITLTDRSSADNAHAMADWNFVSPGFFKTLGVRFLAGRTFDEDQWVATRSAPPPAASDPPDYSAVANPLEVVISDAMARKFWPDQNPLGQIFHWGRQDPDILRETLGVVRWAREWDPLYPPPSPLKVVGVVTDVRDRLEGESGPTYYTLNVRWGTRLFVRTSVEPAGMAEVLRREIEAVDSEITVSRIRTIDEIVSELSADSRFRALMVVSYAVMATLITCLGLFGVLTFAMAQRTREIGVRVTLGATRRDIARLVLGQGARLAGVGIGVGLLLVVWMTRYVSSLLYGVVALDPLTLAAVTALIFGLALFAAYLPARMAMRVDPIEALRKG